MAITIDWFVRTIIDAIVINNRATVLAGRTQNNNENKIYNVPVHVTTTTTTTTTTSQTTTPKDVKKASTEG